MSQLQFEEPRRGNFRTIRDFYGEPASIDLQARALRSSTIGRMVARGRYALRSAVNAYLGGLKFSGTYAGPF